MKSAKDAFNPTWPKWSYSDLGDVTHPTAS